MMYTTQYSIQPFQTITFELIKDAVLSNNSSYKDVQI